VDDHPPGVTATERWQLIFLPRPLAPARFRRSPPLSSGHSYTMSEVVNALFAFAVIVFIFRWATSSPSPLLLPFLGLHKLHEL
jgi:hypothetical protein